jgi:chromosome partitioning protein
MARVSCSICNTGFEPHFRYQSEVRVTMQSVEPTRHYYCSQKCLEESHRERANGLVKCAACATTFEVTLALQVLFTGGKRHYACSARCRERIHEGARALRLGELVTERDSNATAIFGDTALNSSINQKISNNFHNVNSRRGTARVVAVFNHKGGTAKTTTAVNVAAGLAARGQRVLLVDTDGQGNVGVSLKLEFERSLYHVIVMGLDYREAIVRARPNLDVLPANETLAAAELYLSGRQNRDRVLRDRLREARDAYDFVLLDCSPSLSLLNQNALVTSDILLCPVACDYLALVGVRQVLRTLRHVNQFLRHPLELFGVLPTLFDARVRICQESYEALSGHFKSHCLSPIRQSSKLKEAPSAGKPLREYAPQSPATADYEAVVERLITHNRSAVRVGLRAGGVA